MGLVSLLLYSVPPAVVTEIVSVSPSSGEEGDTVRISCTRLRSGASVTIGGVSATIIGSNYGVSGAYLDVSAPAHAVGAVDVVVTDYHGSSTLTNGFTYALAPAWRMDFRGYANDAAFLADSSNWSTVSRETSGTNGSDVAEMAIDASVSDPGVPSSDRTLRYHINHGATTSSIVVRNDHTFPSPIQELWLEARFKWSTNFSTYGGVGTTPNSHKFFFVTTGGNNGRWAFYNGDDGGAGYHTFHVEKPAPDAVTVGGPETPNIVGETEHCEPYWASDDWHVLRMHCKQSTDIDSADGVFEVWFDGTKFHSETGLNHTDEFGTSPELLHTLSFCRNQDDGPVGRDMYVWWSLVKYYTSNPGWT